MRRISRSFSCAVLGCALAGCLKGEPNSPAANNPTVTTSTTQPANNAPVAASNSAVTVRIADGAEYRRAVAERKGQVVLVDFWATWCIPCVERFPHIVELHEKHAGEGLSVISVSLDDPSEEAQVRQFLGEKRATFENLVSKFGGGTESADSFDIPGEVPFYVLFDRTGKQRFVFSGQPEGLKVANCEALDRVDQRVAELLAEKSP